MAAEKGRGENWRGKKPEQARTHHAAAPRRIRMVLPVLGVMLVIAGVLVGFILRVSKPTEVYGISIALNEMKDPHWPVPAWARQDGERLMPVGAETVKPLQEHSRASILVKLGEASLNARGEKSVEGNIIATLSNRLKVEDFLTTHPELLKARYKLSELPAVPTLQDRPAVGRAGSWCGMDA